MMCALEFYFFIDRVYSNADLSNPNLLPPEVDTSLVKLYDDIRITVRREAGIISSVFPQPATVMQVLLQRVFAQSVRTILSTFSFKITEL